MNSLRQGLIQRFSSLFVVTKAATQPHIALLGSLVNYDLPCVCKLVMGNGPPQYEANISTQYTPSAVFL